MTLWRRIIAATQRRIRGPYRALGVLDARVHDVQARLADVQAQSTAAQATHRELRARSDDLLGVATETHRLAALMHQLLDDEVRGVLRALVAEESANRRRLHRLRADPGYALAWTEPQPLVTVTVTTRARPELLVTRALPSILAQTHAELEVIVVGDHAGDATAEAVGTLDDPRIAYRNLTQHLHFTDDPRRHWLVASTMARNEAMRLARGRWVVAFDDDDALRPDCVERLLTRARQNRLEAVYAQAWVRRDDEREFAIGVFPPQHGQFTWAGGMYHAGLRFFERELVAADRGLPGDWFLAQRMLRAGVRFGMVDAVLCDIYPSPMNAVEPTPGAG